MSGSRPPSARKPSLPAPASAAQAMQGAAAAYRRGDWAEAERLCRRVIRARPDHFDALTMMGAIAAQTRRARDAAKLFRRAVAANPDDARAQLNLGSVEAGLGRLDEALACFDRAVALAPRDPAVHNNRGIALRDLKRPADAVASFDRAVALAPGYAAAYSNRGNALNDLGRREEALASFDRAIALRPDHAETQSNRGVALRGLERLDEARSAFRRALKLKPDHTDARWNLTVMQLLAGDFGHGWQGYLDRPNAPGAQLAVSRERLYSSLAGKRVFVLGEQGLGDEIFFLRFVAKLKELGAWTAYRPDPRIAAMLGRLPFLDRVVGADETPDAIDYRFAAGDLPFVLGMKTVADVPPPIALTPAPADLAAARRRLAAFGPPPHIGVTWRAGPGEKGTLSKAAPPERFGALLRPVPGTAVIVQRHPDPDETARFRESLGRPAHDLSALNDDLDVMLALMDALDDYVCVSNTNLHLRTACGHGCRVLVPVPPEFRWMDAGPDSPWFPGTRLYRESAARGWEDAFDALAAELAARPAPGA